MQERPTHEEIAARAYEIYVDSGCKPGHDVDNWLQAEYELMQLPIRELAKLPPPKRDRQKNKYKSVVEVVRLAML